MWLEDLIQASQALEEKLGEYHGCYNKVLPCADGGIVFVTDTHDYKWFPDGKIVKFEHGDWKRR